MLELSLISWGSMIMLVGIGLLANTYFFGFSALLNDLSYQEFARTRAENKNTKIYQLLPPYSILALMVGMLFKFMAWPGGNLIIISGVVLMGIGFYFILKNKEESKSFKNSAIKRMVITGVFAIVFYLLPNFFWFDIINRNNPSYIEATKKVYSDPGNEVYRQELEDEIQKKKDGL